MTVVRSYRTPKGGQVKMAMRPDTVDEPVISSTSMHDEYGVGNLDLQPDDLFLDVGAYVGSVGCAVAADYPEVRVVMVEAVPENAAVIRETVAVNEWGDRVTVYTRSASSIPGESTVFYGAMPEADDFQRTNRFIGGLLGLRSHASLEAHVENLSLSAIVAKHGPVAAMKIDCEGCEYPFLDDPAIAQVGAIIGEFHRGYAKLVPLLEATHEMTLVSTDHDTNFGIFTAIRR